MEFGNSTFRAGNAKIKWNEIPLSDELNTLNLNIKINDVNNNEHSGGTAINVGNPHIIFFVDEIKKFNIEKIGPQIWIGPIHTQSDFKQVLSVLQLTTSLASLSPSN